jgi:hypothetical protein
VGDELGRIRSFRIVVITFVVAILLNALFTVWSINNYQNQSRAQGVAIEKTLCHTLDSLSALNPPPGNPADNPSRAYLQQQHKVLSELGSDLKCP